MTKLTRLAVMAAGALLAVGFSSAALARPYGPGPGPWHDWRWGPVWYPGPVVVVTPDPGPPVIYTQPAPAPVWVEKTPTYRYYCPDPAGYYPKIGRCPKGWMKVVADKP
ncbi:hypothetical protein [Musicola paradisiaca]|uniref:Lipoprotein n=1 Tax=Musicola paradisiaca (strain Ech703) TaxID=579405 RepID=C6C3W6_MUSP7|nr:hypothetical protein [Musicola paradisiaca]ACS87293.1 hypothetical protein Dd703_3535 [Musicola paradisiaca Ech703]